MARPRSVFLRASLQFSYRWATPGAKCQYARILSSPLTRKYYYSTDRPAAAAAPARQRSGSKVFKSADEAIADLQDGMTLLSAGFGLCGVADTLIQAIHKKGLQDLTAVSNNAGAGDGGLALLTKSGRLSRIILSYLGSNKELEKQYLTGQIAVELCPQGTLAEKLRAAGAGIPAFYTSTGGNTFIETGEIPARFTPEGILEKGKPKETRIFNGKSYLMETALQGDVAILRAWKVDEAGNCVFKYTTKTYAGLMAKAAKLSIVEAENIVPLGAIHPDEVDLPGIFIDRIVPATAPKHIENLKLAPPKEDPSNITSTSQPNARNRIAKRAALELKDGFYVNLGVGIPTLSASYLPPNTKVWLQSENGILGMGPYPASEKDIDADLINAGKETVTLLPGASTFDSAESFGMIRGGHVDVSILGAFQVSASGDLANYMIPGKVFKGMGGAMDLVSNPEQTKIVVATEHVDKQGRSKIVQDCKLPLTGKGVVSTIITDLAVFQVDRVNSRLTLTEVAEGVDVETVREKTDANFDVAEDLGTF
ncbi:succinyl-CoA:3-ketoacid-coenzyme A transferase 1 [Pseudomassariella vexata]|uniref:Succinyl-CoA:3-ketoacid-coenzyme A transferase n=1 Tax=Pseudomassariella vexata TaxID=1141098 RepID=A0A1Y2EGS1_9PEZI|nr:succinyl-CoA:3-ketoacid-coenzyme A transferase 1 [Pseudomassariella vexata]ORY70456.1 succinyl-CoA:3-ketoacid-coenzyme A transferase 1 [Pseudomassariella vexata]